MAILHRTLLALVAALTASLTLATSLPDDFYKITNLEDGTSSWQSLTNTSAPAIIVVPETKRSTPDLSSAKFGKRRTDCWGHMLNRGDTDSALQHLREWAGGGRDFSSGPGPAVYGATRGDMIAYYCITLPWRTGNLHVDDVNHAIREMDAKCRPYEASWYGWDGSFEIVGKSRIVDRICIGPF